MPEAGPLHRYLQGSSSLQSLGIKQGASQSQARFWVSALPATSCMTGQIRFPSLNFIFPLCEMS